VILGTRSSSLAMAQTNIVVSLLAGEYIEIKKINTSGDKIIDKPLRSFGIGAFVRELDAMIVSGEIDLAVNSLKDMPTILPEGLCLTAVTKRANAGDAFVSNKYASIETLPQGAVLGTSSLRRKAQLLAARPDLKIVDLRGNVDTRLRKLDDGQMDAIILAAAGLTRLGYTDRISGACERRP